MNREKVLNLINEALEENEALFLIDFEITSDNLIKVTVDGDSGVALSECMRISRNVEHNLDREEEDFSIVVSSPDISDSLVNKRQYQKNINRIMKVFTEKENFEGKLVEINQDSIKLQWKAREPKPIGKGKVTVEKEAIIPLDEIRKAKVKIIF